MNELQIQITHFINPHMFWFEYVDDLPANDRLALELDISRHFGDKLISNRNVSYKPKVGEIAAAYYNSTKSFIRVKIDHIMEFNSTDNKYLCWAIDRGVPFHSTASYIRKLPVEFQERKIDLVKFAGLQGIAPAEMKYDYMEEKNNLEMCENWSQRATKLMQDLIYVGEYMYFTNRIISASGQLFGDLIVTTNKRKNINITQHLIKSESAMLVPNFVSILERLATVRIKRYEDNSRNIDLKFHDNSCKVSMLMTDEGGDDMEPVEGREESCDKVMAWKQRNDRENRKQRQAADSDMEQPPLVPAVMPPHRFEAEPTNSVCKSKYQMIMDLRNNVPRPDESVDGVMNMLREQSLADEKKSNDSVQALYEKLMMRKNKAATTATKAEEQPKSVKSTQEPMTFLPAGYDLGSLSRKPEKMPQQPIQARQRREPVKAASSCDLSDDMKQCSEPHRTVKTPGNFSKALEDERCMPDGLSGQRVFVHGKQIDAPVSLKQANFAADVHRWMKRNNFCQNFRIQTYAWPHIMRRRSFIVVNAPNTGKTMCYVPAIASLIKYAKEEDDIPTGTGPIAIVVCASTCKAEQIKQLMVSLKLDTVVAFGVRNLDKVLHKLLVGCDVLVVTPPCFSRLYEADPNVFVGERIKHLVFDDMDVSLVNYRSDLEKIFCLCRKGDKDDFQLVVTSRIWRQVYQNFVESCDAVLCIGAYIEAAAYGRCEIKLRYDENRPKASFVMKFIEKGRYQVEKTIVVCNDRDEVEQLTSELKQVGVVCLYAHEGTSSEDLAQLETWNGEHSDKRSLMICSDEVLSELKVDGVTNLIHFSMPSHWSTFCFRFSVFFGSFENTEKRPVALVLLDKSNKLSLPRLAEFLNTHYKPEWKKDILDLVKESQRERELAKRQGDGLVPMCQIFLEFGRCHRESSCPERHEFTSSDLSVHPIAGWVKLHILEIFSPVHYAARIVAQTDQAGSWQPIKNNFAAFAIKFATHFGDPVNHISHHPVCLGDICAIRGVDETSFCRCEVMQLIKETKSVLRAGSNRVLVKLIDSGKIVNRQVNELLALPATFQEFPAQAIDVRLTGVIPLDFETDWSTNALKTIKSWMIFDEDDNKQCSLQANVRLSIRNTIWVDKLGIVEDLPAIKRHTWTDLKESLVKKKFCQADSTAIQKLTEMIREEELRTTLKAAPSSPENEVDISSSLCETSGEVTDEPDRVSSVSITSEEPAVENGRPVENAANDTVDEEKTVETTPKENTAETVEIVIHQTPTATEKWSAIEDIECHHVSISFFETPNKFYVQRNDQFEEQCALYQTILKFLDASSTPIQHPEIGMNCLVSLENKFWRAKILELLEDNFVQLFLVDLGEVQRYGTEELLQTSREIVEQAPFQAILCNLVGVQAKAGGEWSQDTSFAIYDYVIEPCELLFVRVIRNCALPPPIEGIQYYDVLLIDCSDGKQDVKINQKVIDEGYAIKDPDSEHFLDLMVSDKKRLFFPESTNDQDDADDDDWDKSCLGKRSSKMLSTKPHKMEINLDDYMMEDFFDDDELQALVRLIGPDANIAEAKEKPLAQIREINNTSELDTVFDKNTDQSSSDSSDVEEPKMVGTVERNDGMPKLLAKYKYAKTKWQQNESLVRLEIDATDIREYKLWVSNSLVQYVQFYEDETKEKEILNINLFGCIDPEWTSHTQCGLNVVVRLVKSIKGYAWPSLMYPEQKTFWLKYKLDSIAIEDSKSRESTPSIDKDMLVNDYEMVTFDDDYEQNDEQHSICDGD